MQQNQRLERNLKSYVLFRIFGKRIYLPVIVIYALQVAHLSIEQLGVIAAITAFFQLALQVPTGYIADQFGYRNTIVVGTFISALSPLLYVFMPNYIGCLLASVLFFGGYAFTDGAQQSLIHSTLDLLGRPNKYVDFIGKVQSKSLVANIFLVAVVPLTYAINPTVPFILGFVGLLVMLWGAYTLWLPLSVQRSLHSPDTKPSSVLAELFADRHALYLLCILCVVAIISATFDQGTTYRELYASVVYHISTQYLGFVTAAGSLVGAIIGYWLGAIHAYVGEWFLYLDAAIVFCAGILIGTLHATIVPLLVLIFLSGYDRNRDAIIHWYVFKKVSPQRKATWVSVASFFNIAHSLWVPLLFAYIIGILGLPKAYMVLFAGIAAVVCVMYGLTALTKKVAVIQ